VVIVGTLGIATAASLARERRRELAAHR
jgi:hypothetical protein